MVGLDRLNVLIILQRRDRIGGKFDAVIAKPAGLASTLSFPPLQASRPKRNARGTGYIREALDQVVFVTDLASLVGSVLLGTKSPCQYEPFLSQGSPDMMDLRSNLVGGRVVLEGNLCGSQRGKLSTRLEGDCRGERLLTMYEGMMNSLWGS